MQLPAEPPQHEETRDLRPHPQEDEDWFQRLSPDFQEAARERWRAREQRLDGFGVRGQLEQRQAMVQGSLVVGVPMLMFGGLGIGLLWGLMAGAAVGWIWHRTAAAQLTCSLWAIGGVVAATSASGLFVDFGPAQGFAFTAYTALLSGALGAIVGLRRDSSYLE